MAYMARVVLLVQDLELVVHIYIYIYSCFCFFIEISTGPPSQQSLGPLDLASLQGFNDQGLQRNAKVRHQS